MPFQAAKNSPDILAFLQTLIGKSPTQQKLMEAFKALSMLPTPAAAEDEEAEMMADLAEMGEKSGPSMKDLLQRAPQAAPKAPASTADMVKEFLAKKGAPTAEAQTAPVSQAPQAPNLLQSMETLLKNTKAEGSQNIKPIAEKAARKMPVRAPATEEAATRLAIKTGMQPTGKDAMGNEFDALRHLYETAYKLQATGAQKKIENLMGEMVQAGGPRAPTPQASIDAVAAQRKIIQAQLQNLLRALGQK